MPSSDYRIPNQMLVNNSLTALQQSFNTLAGLQSEASSLKKLSKPSDAPGDVSSAMQLHASLDRNDQYTRNLSDAQGWLGNADNALQTTVTQLQQVNDVDPAGLQRVDRRQRPRRHRQPDRLDPLEHHRGGEHAVRGPPDLRRHRRRRRRLRLERPVRGDLVEGRCATLRPDSRSR